MEDLHGKAIQDYYRGAEDATLLLHNNYGEPEEMPVEAFFREEEDLSTLEHLAMIECKGTILDLGAGAGAHSLLLQAKGFDVTALENSIGCIEVLKQSGMQKVIHADYQKHLARYDTILVLMNGIGLSGTIRNVPTFLEHCFKNLNPGGQILVDSSDISYLYEDHDIPKPAGYFGEVKYQYEYQGIKGDWFNWVYIDQESLIRVTDKMNVNTEILHTDENDQYLARITKD